MRGVIAAIIVVVLVPAVYAQAAGDVRAGLDDVEQRRVADERRLLEIAAWAEGELCADLALRLVETRHVRIRSVSLEAIEMALAKSSEAREPHAVVMISRQNNDNVEGYREGALQFFRSDRLTLRCRAITALLDIDRSRARFELDRVPADLGLRPESCADGLMPAPDEFYRTLGAVLRRGYSSRERLDGLQWVDASRWVGGIESVSQIAPASRMILAIEPPTEVLASLAEDLAAAIRKLPASPRGVIALAGHADRYAPIRDLLDALPERSAVRKSLEGSLRGLVIGAANTPSCRDVGRKWWNESLEALNEGLFGPGRIPVEELRYSSGGDAPEFSRLWTSAESQRMLEGFQVLNTARREMEPGADRTGWRLEYSKYVGKLRDWNGASERSDVEYLLQKASLASGVIGLAETEAMREEVTRDFVATARHANAREIAPSIVVWLIDMTVRKLDLATRQPVLEALRSSAPRSVAAYAALELEGVDVFRITPAQASP